MFNLLSANWAYYDVGIDLESRASLRSFTSYQSLTIDMFRKFI